MRWRFTAEGPTGKKTELVCIVDTGATFTALHPDELKAIDFKSTGYVGMSTANGNVRDVIGELKISSWLDSTRTKPTKAFEIKCINGPNLLGADFLKAAKLMPDLVNERLVPIDSVPVE